MPTKYEEHQNLDGVERSQKFRNGSRLLQSFQQRICYGYQLHLLFLGLILLLLVIICVIGSQTSKLRWDLSALRTTSLNFSSSATAEIQALNSQCTKFQGMVTSLQSQLEKHKQELQAAHSLQDKVSTLESKLDKELEELKGGQSNMLLAVQQQAKDLKSLTCQITALKSNGSHTTCCPVNWIEYKGSCYWFSHTGTTWHKAQQYCQLENAHLVVVTSQDEQNFIQAYARSIYTWIGLTDEDGPWKWVDGTDYETGFKNWRPQQPDNWYGHGLGGGEDCAHFTANGWNDDICQRPYRWVCETALDKGS